MLPRLFVWLAPNLFVVVGCRLCRRDVRVRWPERWRDCSVCGERAGFKLSHDKHLGTGREVGLHSDGTPAVRARRFGQANTSVRWPQPQGARSLSFDLLIRSA
jgi:hypothetical protein